MEKIITLFLVLLFPFLSQGQNYATAKINGSLHIKGLADKQNNEFFIPTTNFTLFIAEETFDVSKQVTLEPDGHFKFEYQINLSSGSRNPDHPYRFRIEFFDNLSRSLLSETIEIADLSKPYRLHREIHYLDYLQTLDKNGYPSHVCAIIDPVIHECDEMEATLSRLKLDNSQKTSALRACKESSNTNWAFLTLARDTIKHQIEEKKALVREIQKLDSERRGLQARKDSLQGLVRTAESKANFADCFCENWEQEENRMQLYVSMTNFQNEAIKINRNNTWIYWRSLQNPNHQLKLGILHISPAKVGTGYFLEVETESRIGEIPGELQIFFHEDGVGAGNPLLVRNFYIGQDFSPCKPRPISDVSFLNKKSQPRQFQWGTQTCEEIHHTFNTPGARYILRIYDNSTSKARNKERHLVVYKDQELIFQDIYHVGRLKSDREIFSQEIYFGGDEEDIHLFFRVLPTERGEEIDEAHFRVVIEESNAGIKSTPSSFSLKNPQEFKVIEMSRE